MFVTGYDFATGDADPLSAGESLALIRSQQEQVRRRVRLDPALVHLAGGALYRSAVTYALGVWSMLSATLAALVGAPGSYLVLSLAGGGGFLVLAVALRWVPGVRARRGAA